MVSGNDFHQGITGIVAGRMKELYNRPCLISIKDELAKVQVGQFMAFL